MAILLFLLALFLAWIIAFGNPGKEHHGKPTPIPTATPIPPSVTLTWNSPADTSNVSGYAIWLGFSSRGENQRTPLGNVLQTTVTLSSGTQYFFFVTAYNANGADSLPSNEISYLAP